MVNSNLFENIWNTFIFNGGMGLGATIHQFDRKFNWFLLTPDSSAKLVALSVLVLSGFKTMLSITYHFFFYKFFKNIVVVAIK